MSLITKIASVETTTAIWEFDPLLSNNHILGDLLDVIAAVRTLAIKVCSIAFHSILTILINLNALQIQCSGQCIKYFQMLQCNCSIEIPLKIPLHSNVRWGTAEGMLGRAYELRQVCSNILVTCLPF